MNAYEKMREALIDVVKRLEARVGCDHHTFDPTATTCDGITSAGKCGNIATCAAIFKARAALAEPPRNCDVIAPQNLVDEFCKFMDFDIMDERNGFADGQYKFMQEHWFEFSKWITMPYAPKEGGAK